MMRKNQLLSTAEAQYKDRGSKFLAFALPIASEAEVSIHLHALKSAHHAARHWCYAWRLGEQAELYRSNDDGEPSGSAGRPILAAIDQHQLTNCLVVVVRYFGGTLLGVRGLIDAYGGAARMALELANISFLPIIRSLKLTCAYQQIAEVQKVMNELNLKPITQNYSNTNVEFRFEADEEVISEASTRFLNIYGLVIQ
ncbi:MAG: IMPACT family protein [Bacteroidia bacterium]